MSDKSAGEAGAEIVEDGATKDALDLLASRLDEVAALAHRLSGESSIADFAYVLSQVSKDNATLRDRLRHARTHRGKARPFGLFAGQFEVGPEFFEPLPEEELRAWGEI